MIEVKRDMGPCGIQIPYEPLPTVFDGIRDVKGDTFKQIKNGNKCYLYARNNGYEVFRKRTQEESTKTIGDKEVHFRAMEIYPRTEDFGLTAWYFTNYEKANEKFEEEERRQDVESIRW